MLAVLGPGDEVVIPAPYWVSYPDMSLLADATPVVIFTGAEQQYKISPAQLSEVLSEKTKWWFLTAPSNPSGALYSSDELAALGNILRDYPKIVIASDDIYEHIAIKAVLSPIF